MLNKATKIFTPGALPTVTYYDRPDLNLEFKLLEAIETQGYLCSVSGPSKSGKTVLCESVIGKTKMLLITGGGIDTEDKFWQKLRAKLNLPIELTTTKTSKFTATIKGSGGGKLQIPLVAEGSGQVGAEGSAGRDKSHASKYEGPNGVSLLEFIEDQNYTLVIDDFHYINRDVQKSLAQQFKEAARSGCHIVIVSVTHRSDDAIRANPDLRGRVVSVDIPYWSGDELRAIPARGFPHLNLEPSKALVDRLVTESILSPQLMQALCLQLCREIGVDETLTNKVEVNLNSHEMGNLLKNTTSIANCKYAFDSLLAGPRTRGEERKVYSLKSDQSGDVYYVVLKALAAGNPILTVSYDELKHRISDLVSGESPRGSAVIEALTQMNSVVKKKLQEDRVLEWDENYVNLPDPYFLYYLRWAEW